MNKVYLIKVEYSDTYDNYESIDEAFATYRGASQHLLNQGFEYYYDRRDDELCFILDTECGSGYFATIIEMGVKD